MGREFHEPKTEDIPGCNLVGFGISFVQNLSRAIHGKQLSSSLFATRYKIPRHIDSESLGLIIKKSGKKHVHLTDSILSTIGAYHYPFDPLNAAHLHIALLTENHSRNR